ncbi:E3 ubiquitin-protein ligase TRIM56-like [Babylonia areolata]|uniref:E3 ubiquitin-protein ligase TRIM56-like n=1 Tax=Babylonia areolata TaxID=304850 RepID=UPI003FD64406
MASVADVDVDVDDKDLECPVCHEEFITTPKILPCYHTACRDCLIGWLKKSGGGVGVGGPRGQGQGGCPLCRAPVLSPPPARPHHHPYTVTTHLATHQGQGHLDTLVDALPTDWLTWSRVKVRQLLSRGSHVCAVCPSSNNKVAASHFCLECAVKLCTTCSSYHQRLPVSKDHSLRDLNRLTARDLASHIRSSCKNHQARSAEVCCPAHEELLCWECATTRHRCCPKLKTIADAAKGKKKELGHLVQKWRAKETELSKQIQARKDVLAEQRKQVTEVFDGLQRHMEKRRQELYDVIKTQAEGDADLERLRATVTSHAATMARVLTSSSDDVVLMMTQQMGRRSKDVETQCAEANNLMSVPSDLLLDGERIAEIRAALSALGGKGEVSSSKIKANTSLDIHDPWKSIPIYSAPPPPPPVAFPSTATTTIRPNRPTMVSFNQHATCTTTTTTTSQSPAVPAITTTLTTGASVSTTLRSTRALKAGDRVRLKGSAIEFIDGKVDPGPGTVTAFPSRRTGTVGTVDVKWDGGEEETWWMGYKGAYDLQLL